MIDANYFRERLTIDTTEKAKEGVDRPSVEVHLSDGSFLRLSRLVQVEEGWVVFEVYPARGLKEHRTEDQKAGGPKFKLERVTVPYHVITRVVLTLEPVAKDMGFQ